MKKLIGVILIVVLCFGSVGVSYAAENDPYKEIVEKYNEEYGVDLGYVPVQGEFDLALYDEVIRDLAKNQYAFIYRGETPKGRIFSVKDCSK